jgi:hypothetical protein
MVLSLSVWLGTQQEPTALVMVEVEQVKDYKDLLL